MENEFYCDSKVIHKHVVDKVQEHMLAENEFEEITRFFKTLGDSTRIKICWALYKHEMCVCDIASLLSMTKSAISHQLRELRVNKLVKCRKTGKTVYYSLDDSHVSSFIKNALEHIRE
ncbi:MAG: winged helix-turn-helix transcriptional regulator [Clostridia bacterium]|nr:winged helix-turn-helix transcriptional regulator [Clostridia bacterium]